jgi:hypothetical protein
LLEFFNNEMTEKQFMDMAKSMLHFVGCNDLKYDRDFNYQIIRKKYNLEYSYSPREFAMRSTPLIQAMAASIPLLHEMKNRHGTEKNTLFVLSDGEDTEGLIASIPSESYKDVRAFLQDARSGYCSPVSYSIGYASRDFRSIAMNVAEMSQFIRQSTGSSTISVFMVDSESVLKRIGKRVRGQVLQTMNHDCGDAQVVSKEISRIFQSIRTYGFATSQLVKSWDAFLYLPSSEVVAKDKWEKELEQKMSKKSFLKTIGTGLMVKEAGAIMARTIVASMNKTVLSD